MRYIPFIFLLASCGTVETGVTKIDGVIDTAADKAIVILVEEHRAMHEKMNSYADWLEQEAQESLDRAQRLRDGLDHGA